MNSSPFSMGGDRQRFHGVAEFQLHVEFDGLEINAIGFDLREIENVVDDVQQRVGRSADRSR